jgi:hypothetical protein
MSQEDIDVLPRMDGVSSVGICRVCTDTFGVLVMSSNNHTQVESTENEYSAVYDDEMFDRGASTQYDDELHEKYDVPEAEQLSFGASEGDAPGLAGEVAGRTETDQPTVGANDAGVRAATVDAQVPEGVGGEHGPNALNHDQMEYVDGSRPAEINPQASATEGRSPGPSVKIVDVEGDDPAFGDILTIDDAEYVAIDNARAVKVPSGASLSTIERIAGETKERLEHAQLARSATDGNLREKDVKEKHQGKVDRTRSSESVDPDVRKVTPVELAVPDQTEFEQREPARDATHPNADMGPHKPFTLEFLEEADGPSLRPQAGGRTEPEACRWMDETADHDEFVSAAGEPAYSPETPMEQFARDAEFAEQVEKRVGAVLKKLEEVGDEEGIDVFAAPSLTAEQILETCAHLADSVGDGLEFVDHVWDCLFHEGSQPLHQIDPWWPGCTAVVRVEDFFVPRDPAKQRQVALVSDVNPFAPNPNESQAPYAKLTVWEKGEPEVTLQEGDVVRIRNGKPGMFNGAFTLSAVYNTSMEIISRGDGEAITSADAERCTDRIRGERVAPEDGLGANRPERPGFDSLSTGRIPLPRYRQPYETTVADMDFDDSGGVVGQAPGARKYRSPTSLVTFHFPEWLVEDDSVIDEDQLVSDRILSSADLVADEAFDEPDTFAKFHRSAFEDAIGRAETEAELAIEEREHPSLEAVFEASLGEETVVRIYSTLVEDWAAQTDAEIRVVARNTSSKTVRAAGTVPRRADSEYRWDHAMIDALTEIVANLNSDGDDPKADPVEASPDEMVAQTVDEAFVEGYRSVAPSR